MQKWTVPVMDTATFCLNKMLLVPVENISMLKDPVGEKKKKLEALLKAPFFFFFFFR